jgi:hypothetical protein
VVFLNSPLYQNKGFTICQLPIEKRQAAGMEADNTIVIKAIIQSTGKKCSIGSDKNARMTPSSRVERTTKSRDS